MEVPLIGDQVSGLVRQGVEGLDAYIELLTALLDEARKARALFQSTVPLPDDHQGRRAGADPGLSGDEGPLPIGGEVLAPLEPQVTLEHFRGISGQGTTDSHYRFRMENALVAAQVSRRDRKLNLLRITASANDGIVRIGVTGHTLIEMGLCQSQPQHLAGYLIKIMLNSGEFERSGDRGSGLYRWLLFKGEAAGLEVPASATGDHEAASGDITEEGENPSSDMGGTVVL